MGRAEGKRPLTFGEMILASGTASCLAEVYTLPVDTVKVRLQVQQDRYKGYISAYRQIAAEEGVLSLWQGLSAGLLRQVFFATTRMSIFDYAMQSIEHRRGPDSATLGDRLLWGLLSGTIAISIANPFDVVKVRFQNAVRASGAQRPRLLATFAQIYRQNGLMAFYQSLPPNILRSSVTNAAELGSYSQCKALFLRHNLMTDGFAMYFLSSFTAGLVAAVVASPFDVIKSRMMAGTVVNGQKVLYGSIAEACRALYREGGLMGFYAGFNANFQRLVSWNVSMFIMKEAITRQILAGKQTKR